MKILPSRDPNLFRVRTGGGFVAFFGLPFLLVGLGVMSIPWLTSEGLEAVAAIPFGLIFALAGGVMVFGRGGIEVDLRRQEVVRWWSVIVRVKSKATPLSEVRQVAVTKEIRKQKNSSITVYPIYLDAQSRVNLVEDQDYLVTRRVAEGIAKAAGVPMSDSSTGTEVVRQATELDESVRDRARRLNERVEAPAPPPMTTLKIRPEAEGLTIDLPRGGLTLMAVLPGIIYCGIALFFILPLLTTVMIGESMEFSRKLIGGAVMFTIFGLVPFSLIGLSVARKITHQVRVVVDGRRLRIEEHYFAGSKTTEFPAEELEELMMIDPKPSVQESETLRQISQSQVQVRLVTRIMRMVRPTGITARSDKQSITFGQNLESGDQVYLYQLIRQAVVG